MDVKEELRSHLSLRHNGGQRLGDKDSLLYSGLVDSLGIQELAIVMSQLAGREVTAAEIVELDLDTLDLLAGHVSGGGLA